MGKSKKIENKKISHVASAKVFITPCNEVTSMKKQRMEWTHSSPWVKKKEKCFEEQDCSLAGKNGESIISYLRYYHYCNHCVIFIIHKPYFILYHFSQRRPLKVGACVKVATFQPMG